ncbi:sensor histidine kinase [Maricaulis sp. CAU 1757]
MRGETDLAGIAMLVLLSLGIIALATWQRGGVRRVAPDEVANSETDRLRRQNEDLSVFAKAAGHDLIEPIRKIETFGERLLAREPVATDKAAAHHVERMVDAAVRMRHLIEGLRAYSKIHEHPLPSDVVDLGEVAQAAWSAQADLAKASGAKFDLGPLPAVLGDAAQIHDMFGKIFANALKYSRDGVPPEIVVRGRTDEERNAVIEISDNGIGIPERHAERIFGMFERLHPRDRFSGSGVGLARCRRIVERHGGQLTASGQEQVGMTLCLILPRAQVNLS